jgi:DNA mismatch endonuclease, patch repair protein
MADVHSKEVRSFNMSRIRARNTRPEIQVRKFLYSNGLYFRLFDKGLPGTPDIVLPKFKLVIFVHGCFWHGHRGCKKFVIPKTRTEFWINKINTNIINDKKNTAALEKDEWKVFTVWECELKNEEILQKLLREINY